MKRFILLFILFTSNYLFSQDPEPDLASEQYFVRNIEVPKSPEVSALLKFGDNEIDMYSGTPKIGVPLFEISGRSSSISYNLSYDASGLKVDHKASWTGSGWSLGGVGVITRINYGQPDDAYFDATTNQLNYDPHYNNAVSSKKDFYKDNYVGVSGEYPEEYIENYFFYRKRVLDGRYDVQPDLYSFSTPNGLSGKFFIDYSDNLGKVIDNDKIKIVPTFVQNGTHKNLIKFEIFDENGNYYKFDVIEYVENQITGIVPGSTPPYDETTTQRFSSSFFLSQMILGEKKDVYDYLYSSSEWQDTHNLKLRTYISNCLRRTIEGTSVTCDPTQNQFSPYQAFPQVYKIFQLLPEEVQINGTKIIEYITSDNRLDLNGSKKLIGLKKYNQNQDIIEEIDFHTSYFTANANPEPQEMRLKLDSISKHSYGSNNNSSLLRYEFDYYKLNGSYYFPSRYSNAQDYWGYFNNTYNDELYPAISLEIAGELYNFDGANRSANINYSQVGTLKSITYPTGGKTEYEYTLHNLGREQQDNSHTWDGLLSFTGGLLDQNANNIYEYYDDACDGIIAGNHSSFNLNINNTNKIFRIISDTQDNNNTVDNCPEYAAIVIYPITDVDPPSYQDFFLGDRDYIYKNDGATINDNFTLDIDNGNYNYMILSNDEYTTFDLEVKDYHSNNPIILKGGGLRVDKILNLDSDETLLGYKRFFYDDYSKYPNITEADFFKKTSGIDQQPLQFSKEFEAITYATNSESALGEERVLSLRRFANNLMTNPLGANVTYGTITELNYSGTDPISKGFTVHKFSNYESYYYDYPVRDIGTHIENGRPLSIKKYDSEKTLVEKVIYSYETLNLDYSLEYDFFQDEGSIEGCLKHEATNSSDRKLLFTMPDTFQGSKGCNLYPDQELISSGIHPVLNKVYYENNFYQPRIVNSKTSRKSGNSWMEQSTDYNYNSTNLHNSVIQKSSTNSDGTNNVTNYEYVADIGPINNAFSQLLLENNLNQLVSMEVLPSNTNSIKQVLDYDIDQGKVLPKFSSTFKNGVEGSKILFQEYDSYGNLLQAKKEDGIVTTYVYGYNNTNIVAQVSNATNNQIQNLTLDWNEINSPSTPANLEVELNKIRQMLPNAMVTSYTYIDGVGVASVTQPNGIINYYEYDAPNRLKVVKDQDGNVLSKNKYNYKN